MQGVRQTGEMVAGEIGRLPLNLVALNDSMNTLAVGAADGL
jgi:hypothetical protein